MVGVICEHGKDPMCCSYCLLHQAYEQQREIDMLRAVVSISKKLIETHERIGAFLLTGELELQLRKALFDLKAYEDKKGSS